MGAITHQAQFAEIGGSAVAETEWEREHTLTGLWLPAQGGTGIAFFRAAGPTVERIYTFPDAAATMLYSGGPLGTPSSGVATNLTGTAAGLTAGTVTTNANLTGPITSVGNATSVAAQTGTGSTFVMQASPTLTTPNIGAATGTSVTLSSLTNTRIPLVSTAGLLTDRSDMTWSATYDNGASEEPRPSVLFPGMIASYTRTDTNATTLVLGRSALTLTPSGAAASTSGVGFKASVTKTGTSASSYAGALNALATNTGSGAMPSLYGSSMQALHSGAGAVTDVVGGFIAAHLANAGATTSALTMLSLDPTGETVSRAGAINGNYVGLALGGMNLDGSLTATNRYILYIKTSSGAPATNDRAIYSLSTAASVLSGKLGIGIDPPTTNFHLVSTDAGTFSVTTSGTVTGASFSKATYTAKGSAAGTGAVFGEAISNCTGTLAAGAYTFAGVNAYGALASTDSAVYPSGSAVCGGFYLGQVLGTSNIDLVAGVAATSLRITNTSTINTAMAGFRGDVQNYRGAGTIPVVAGFYGKKAVNTNGCTYTVCAGFYAEDQRPAAGTNPLTAVLYGAAQTAGSGGAVSYYLYQAGVEQSFANVPTRATGRVVGTSNARAAAAATYTVGAADGSFLVSGNVLVTTSTTHSFSLDVDYTDESNVARTLLLPMAQLAGNFVTGGLITNVTGAGPYESAVVQIRCKAATTITIRVSNGTFTTVAYNSEGLIAQSA